MKSEVLLFAFLIALPAVAIGAPIALTFSGAATGILGANSFTGANFTLTSTGDTSSVVSIGSVFYLPVTTSMIDISGLPNASLTAPGTWSDPQGSNDAIFQDTPATAGGVPAQELGITRFFAGLETYQFATSLGPVTGFAFSPDIIGSFANIATDQGILTISATSMALTFDAVVSDSPEPRTGLLLAGALAALLAHSYYRRSIVRPEVATRKTGENQP